jgi:TPR repeat protein
MKPLLALCLALALAGPGAAAVVSAPPQVDQSDPNGQPPADDAHCTTCDGLRLLAMGEYDRAMHVFQLRAAQGDLVATNEIGVMYEQGLGVPVDYNRARQYYTRVMKAGAGVGMISLGKMYEQGHGVAVDESQAQHYYSLAATAGDPDGIALLGTMYQHGMGVPVDYGHAMRLYHEAIVAGGDSLAMEQIGFMLQHGLGGPANPKEAWCWYVWADANGQPNASAHLAELAAAGQEPVSDCSVLNQWPVKQQRAAADPPPVPRQR